MHASFQNTSDSYVAEIKAVDRRVQFTMALQMMPPTGEQASRKGLLRIGIVLDSYNVSAWIATVIDDLLDAHFLQVGAIVILAESNSTENATNSGLHWLFQKYAAWDAQCNRLEDDPLRIVDVRSRLAGTSGTKFKEYPSARDLIECHLDVLIWLSSREPEAAVSSVARYGLWRYQHQEAAHFWEIYCGDPVTRSALEVLHDERDTPQVIYEAYSATRQGWSWLQNQNVPFWRASTFMLRSLTRLRDSPGEGLSAIQKPCFPVEPRRESREIPSNLQVTGFLLRNAARTLSRRIRYARKESHWFVAYRTDRSKFISNTEEVDLCGFKQIQAPDGHFYADPFVIKWRNRNYLFVEDYPFAERKGCISVMEIDKNGATEAERVLDLPYHLSYPFVFEHEGELYMIPETLKAERIDLYRAGDMPTRWEFVKTLKQNVQAVDTTLWFNNGEFYFFTNIAERGSTVNDELYLFCADDLLGEWKAHPGNPIATDVRCSRGAGKLFLRNGKLIRPAQDCSVRYGYACQLNEVEVLTPTAYRERRLARIEPDWAPGLIGTHTINSNEDFEVIDGQVYGKRYAAKQ